MAKDRVNMPASTAGLTRYFDDYKSKIEFSPWAVVAGCLVLAALIILFHIYGKGLLV